MKDSEKVQFILNILKYVNENLKDYNGIIFNNGMLIGGFNMISLICTYSEPPVPEEDKEDEIDL